MCLGISQYPELMVIVNKLKLDTIPISYEVVDWNKTFEVLDGTSRIDFVIANYELHINKNRNNGNTVYLYRPTLIKYNSFYIICKEKNIKSFKEVKKQGMTIKNTIKFICDQLNKLERPIKVFACEETDHLESFKNFNNLFGKPLLTNVQISQTGTPKEILQDFIDSDDGIYIGGIPERINLLKRKLFIVYRNK
ncbi:MAG: hypothetical protein IPN49_15690 [Saprospiraceae bacterium]|nr:hypothetical protein [Saprospiraceae bacterium]